jgi:hypothetical protein
MSSQQIGSISQPERSPNIITRLHNKYNDLEEEKYTAQCKIALMIMDLLYKTEQCTEEEYNQVKDFILYTKDNLAMSVFQLDMMVNPNDRLPYDQSKYHQKKFEQYVDMTRQRTKDVMYRITDIQELLLITTNEINKILNTVLIRNDLINYWE